METETQLTHSAPPAQKNKRLFLFCFIGLVAVAAVLCVVVAAVRIYSRAANDSFSLAVAKTFRLPAAKVNGLPILYADYAEDLKAINTMQAYSQANGGNPTGNLTPEQMSDQVLLRLVSNVLLNQAAKEYNVSVAAQDVTDLTTQVLQQFKTPAEADSELMQRYGWNLVTYQQKVMKPYILQNKLTEKIQSDTAAREEVRKRAQSVLDQIKAGADFRAMPSSMAKMAPPPWAGIWGSLPKAKWCPSLNRPRLRLKKGK